MGNNSWFFQEIAKGWSTESFEGRAEKEAMKKLESEEIEEEAKSNEALEVSQGDHHSGNASRCKGEYYEVHVGFGNTAQY